MTDEMTLPAIPNFADVPDEPRSEPWVDGWYAGTFLAARTFTTRDGNEVTHASEDTVSKNGDSRNITLQAQLTRRASKGEFNGRVRLNYRPAVDFTTERIARIAELNSGSKDDATSDEVRSRIALGQLKRLQKIAGATFARNGNGGLDLTPVFGKGGFFRIKDGDPNPTTGKVYKEIVEFAAEPPKKGTL
jgi:hypothetical protein